MRQSFVRFGRICAMISCLAFIPGMCAATPTARQQKADAEASALFDFHSGFWINLHHFLYLEALAEHPRPGPRPAILSLADAHASDALSAEERATWNAAVSFYASHVIQRDLLFDQSMGELKNRLEDAEQASALTAVDIPADMKTVLSKAAPIYRKYWWARHDAQNRAWIAQLQPLVAAHGESLAHALADIYRQPWPGHPVRVDAVIYAGQFGAYTTNEPTRPTISTTDPANRGVAALEIVFHETSHGMMDQVMQAMQAAEQKVAVGDGQRPFQTGTLWHAVLFYTAGELVAERIPSYRPYADANGLWTRAWPEPDRSLIERDWKPHMAGAIGLEPALTKLVTDLAAARKPAQASAH